MTEPVTLRLLGENGQLVGVLRSTTEEQKKYRKSTEETGEAITKTYRKGAAEVGLMDRALTGVNGSAKELARTFAAGLGFAGVASSITYAISSARDFNVEIAKVSTALSDTSKLNGYANSLREMAVQYGISAKQQAASLYEIISAGQDAETAMSTLDAANRLAVGGLTSVETAADGLTSVMNAYAGKVKDAAEVSDVLFVGAAAGKTNIEQLSSTLGLVANTASVVGVSLQELVGSIATITLSGVQTSVAVTQMRAALNGVIKPSAQAAELAQKLGLQFDIAAIKTKGWAGFLEDVQAKTQGNTTALTTLFGSVEAVGAVLSLTGEKAAKFADVLQQTQEAAGATEVAFGKMSATADVAFNRAKQAATDLFITLGSKLLTALAPLAIAFADNIENIASVLGVATKIAAAYVAVFVVMPAIFNATAAALSRVTAAIVANNIAMELGVAGAGKSFAASIKSIGAVKAAAGTLFALWAGWEIGTELREKFVEVRVAGIALIAGLMKSFENLKYGVSLVWEGIKLAALLAFEAITEGLAGLLRSIAEVGDVQIGGQALFGDTVAGLNEMADGLSNALDPIGNFKQAVAEQSKALLAAHKQIDQYAEAEVAFEMATVKATAAQKANNTVTAAATSALKLEEDATKKAKEALKAYTEGWKANAKAREAEQQALDEYQQSRTNLADGYANEIELLSRTNTERAVGDQLLRYMSQNFEHLRSLTDEAAKAELEHAEAIIRSGEAGIRAGDKINDLIQQFYKLNDTPLDGLISNLGLLQAELKKMEEKELLGQAFDPERVTQLRGAISGLNEQIANETQKALEDNVSTMQMGFRSLQSMTEEGSDAFKAMEVAIQALNVVQAIGAVLNQGNGDPYTAFARMAAMAAAVAGLVGSIGSFSGGGASSASAASRQETQGRGTVLGDREAQSESIANAINITAEATTELVGINRGMLTALQRMQAGIDGAAASISRTGFADLNLNEAAFANAFGPLRTIGGALLGSIFGGDQDLIDQGLLIRGGSFGNVSRNPNASSYQTIETDGGWFHSDDIDDELEALGETATTQIRLILTSIGDTVREAAIALGLNAEDFERAIAQFQLEEIRISTMDLSGEEAQAELEAAFSAIFDGLAGAVVPFIGQFQQVGEGLGETLVRVATSVQVAQEGIRQLGLAVDDAMNPEQYAQMSVALIEAAGGIEQFISGMQSFVANFAPEAYRLQIAQDELTRGLEQVGLALPSTREGFWELMQSLDATTASGQAQIAALLRLSSYADAYYDSMEQGAEDAAEAARRAEEAERDRAATIAGIIAQGADAMAENAINIGEYGLSPLARQQAAIQRETNAAIAQATREGANAAELATISMLGLGRSLQAVRLAALEFSDQLEEWTFEDSIAGMEDLDAALARNDRLWQERLNNAVEIFGEGSAEVTQVMDLWARSNTRLRDAAEDADKATEKLTITLSQLFSQLGEYMANLREQFANLLNPGFKSWIQELTGFSEQAQTPIVSRADTLAAIGEQYAAGIFDLQSQLATAQAELANLGAVSSGPQRAIVQQRIRLLEQLLQQVTGTMGDAVEYANQLFQQQIDGLLAGLTQEFGTNNPIDLINDRFDLLIEQATAWGASMAELAEIESYRIIALERAEEEQFEQQMEYYRQLREFRDSLLLDQNLTTLTPMEQLAEAQRQYNEALEGAATGDANAQRTFQDAARAYLENLRMMFGSSQNYTDGFNQVIADINRMLANSPLGSTEAFVDAVGNGNGSDQEVQVNTDPVVTQLVTINATLADGFMLVAEELGKVGSKVDKVTDAVAQTTAAVDRLAVSGRIG